MGTESRDAGSEHAMDGSVRRVITTSWDDGHPCDLRLAELLVKWDLQATFYVPTRRCEGRRLLSTSEIRALATRFEIGAHTVNHPVLTQLGPSEARREIRDSKRQLEDIIGRRVLAFAFPRGRYSAEVVKFVKEADFACARTTDCFGWQWRDSQFLLRPTIQAYPHGRLVYVRKVIYQRQWETAWHYGRETGFSAHWVDLAEAFLATVRREGGVWHLWGHSEEIDRLALWRDLEAIFRRARERSDWLIATNGEIATMQMNGAATGQAASSCRAWERSGRAS